MRKCICGAEAVVGLDRDWLCHDCFDAALHSLDGNIRKAAELARGVLNEAALAGARKDEGS